MSQNEFVSQFRFVISDKSLEPTGQSVFSVVKELNIRINDISVTELQDQERRNVKE